MLMSMKHDCPFCGHTLDGTELGIHINTLEAKVVEPDPMIAQLHAEMLQLAALQQSATAQASDAAQAAALTLPHFG